VRKALRILRVVITIAILIVALAGLAGWWTLHRALPQLDGAITLPGLHARVDVERDAFGIPHIRAQSLEDLLVAQGYVMAQDRLWQMDLLRRAAAGQLAEIFGDVALNHDVESRTLGFTQAADATLAAMPADRRGMLEAYARGVNAFIDEHRGRLPPEFVVLRYEPRPWAARDTLLIAANLYKELTGFWKDEILRAQVAQTVGPELANDLYAATADSGWDHPLVGMEPQPARPSSAGFSVHPEQGEGPVHLTPATTWPAGSDFRPGGTGFQPVRVSPATASPAGSDFLSIFNDSFRGAGGSNNWVVSGSRTRSGRPMLENDTHLGWAAPSLWYLVHLTAPGWNVKGFALPGGPLVVIGHNDRIAWGFTNNFADVLDVYAESFNSQNPLEYRVNGQWQRATVRREVIHVRGGSDRTVDVVLTRHGPVIERDGLTGYAIRWTATEPGGLDANYFLLGSARNWDEFRAILRETPGPAQNALYADVDGHIGYIVSALVPIRRQPAGSIPVPGDNDDYEWTGYIPRDELPQLYDPPEGIIATANARVTGPSYKWHLTDHWMAPYRTARIYELLGNRKDLTPADCIQISTDIYSYPHVLLAKELIKLRKRSIISNEHIGRLLDALDGWDGRASVDSVAMSFLEFTRRALLFNLLQPHLGSNAERYQWMRTGVFLERVLRERPARWLPPPFHDYDDLLFRSMDQAVKRMAETFGSDAPQRQDWGRFNLLRMFHPLGRYGVLRSALSVGPIPISGNIYSVKQITPAFGPSMRFVADLSNFDNSLMNVTMGESGQFLSPYYKDQFNAWYEGRGIPSKFSPAAEQPLVVHRLQLLSTSPR